MTPSNRQPTPLSRRRALTGAAGIGVALPVLAACGSDSDSSGASGSGSSGSGGTITTSDIEVGGGTIYSDQSIVVTQPTEGEFKAFSTTCTHTGCPVSKIEDGKIICPCHGSQFSIEDGSPTQGPATSPLASKKVSVSGTTITVS